MDTGLEPSSASAFPSRPHLNADLAFEASMRRESRVCYPAFVFRPCWRDAEFILASAFSCPDLNAGLEPRVVAPWQRNVISRVCYSRVCHSCNANPTSAIPAFVIPASAIPATRLPRLRPSRLTLKTRVYLCFRTRSELHGFRTFRQFR